MQSHNPAILKHPLQPFFPPQARLLMLGSFPPERKRWSMDFFYPNFQNDMWRIFGLVFFENKSHFEIADKKAFDKSAIENFLRRKNIALYDTAVSAIRTNDDASDAFLEVTETIDLATTLAALPHCTAIAATGKKASEIISTLTGAKEPRLGEAAELNFANRHLRFYRMPSSSRAYPKPLAEKAAVYAEMFRREGIL